MRLSSNHIYHPNYLFNLDHKAIKRSYFKISGILRRNVKYMAGGVFAVAFMSGCTLEQYRTNTDFLPVWQVKVLPPNMCVGDRLRIKYRIANECPAGFSCEGFYPTIRVSSSNPMIFPTREYHNMTYSGEIASNPISSAAPLTIDVSSTFGAPPYDHFVYFRSDASNPRRAIGSFQSAYAPPITIEVNPIDVGVQVVRPITFNGQCAGRALTWTAVNLATEDGMREDAARSESVRIRRLCNRDARWVTFTAHFSSGLPDQDSVLMPNECIDISSEAPPAMITSLTARPNTELPGELMPHCLDSIGSSPPSPIRAELTLGCQ